MFVCYFLLDDELRGVIKEVDVFCKPVVLVDVVIKPSNEYRGCLDGG